MKLECTGCGLQKTCSSPILLGRGNKKSGFVVVGDHPDPSDITSGLAFGGKQGNFLRRSVYRAAGIEEEDLYYTYAVRCAPVVGKKATMNHLRPCRQHLVDEILALKPKAIVLAGNVALHGFLNLYHTKNTADEKKAGGLTGIHNWRGKQVWSREFNCWLVPTYSTATLMADRYMSGVEYRIDATITDFELAGKLARQPRPEIEYPTPYHIHNVDKALQVVEGVQKSKLVAFDIEAEDLDPRTSCLLGISLSDRTDRGFYIPEDLIVGSKRLRKAIEDLMTNDGVTKLLHNGPYDIGYLRVQGWPKIVNWKDTMIASSLDDENFPKGLKPLTWRHLTFGGYDRELDDYRRENKLKSYKGIPQDILGKYAAYDAVASLQLHTLFSESRNAKVESLYSNVLMPVRDVMCDAEFTGFNVDVDRAHFLDKKCDEAVNQMLQKMYALVGYEFNLRSPLQLANVLYKDMKLKPLKVNVKKDGTKSFSCDKASLVHCAAQKNGELARMLLDIKYIQGQQSKFVKLVIKNAKEDGRVHTSYNLTGTVTGRTSCSNPGIHNIPRDRFIRSMFIPSAGNRLVEADVKSAELRCLAIYSNEKFLLDAFNEGKDMHTATYNVMFNKPKDYVPTDDERFIAKSINFGLVYGRGPKSLAEVLKVDVMEAVRLIELYFKQMPNVAKFLRNNVIEAHKNGYVSSVFGRRRNLPLIHADDGSVSSKAERQANNSIIQSAAADFTYIVLARVGKLIKSRGLQAKIVHSVHDSIVIDTPVNEIDLVKSLIEKAYQAPVNVLRKVKMEMDIDDVGAWGESKPSRLAAVLYQAGVIKRSETLPMDLEAYAAPDDDYEEEEHPDEE